MALHSQPVRILFVTSSDRVYLPHFFETWFRLMEGNRAVEVVQTPLVRSWGFALARMWSFPAYFIPLALWQLLHALFRRGHAVPALCRERGIPVSRVARVDSRAFEEILGRFRPHYLISVGCIQIFPPQVVASDDWVPMNLHNGRIPGYRGAMAPLWALVQGESPVITWHRMVPAVDAGGVLLERVLPLEEGESFHGYSCRLLREAAALLAVGLEAMPDLHPPDPDMSKGRYWGWPTAREGRLLRARGVPLWFGKPS